MTAGEIIGLAALTSLLGGVLGAVLVASRGARQRDARDRRERLLGRYARWLGARHTLSRASCSVVVAFRALGSAPSDSPYHKLRTKEAHRARADWCRALRRLDESEAALLAFDPEYADRENLAGLPRAGADALRLAIDGAGAELTRLTRQLEAADRRAEGIVRTAGTQLAEGRPASVRWIARITRDLESIVRQWSLRARSGAEPHRRRDKPDR